MNECPIEDLRTTGLLWLINAAVFHPRGFALALIVDDGVVTGWTMLGDGTEPWSFGDGVSDEMFGLVEAFLAGLRPEGNETKESPETP